MAFRKKRTELKEIDAILKKRIKPYYPTAVSSTTIAELLKIDESDYMEMIKNNDVPYAKLLDYCIEIELDPSLLFYKTTSRLRRLH